MNEAEPRPPAGTVAVILAAGRSRRLRSDREPHRAGDPPLPVHKALLPFPDQPLIVVHCENYLAAGVERIYCVLGAAAAATEPVLTGRPGVTVLINRDWPSGMFSSVKTGLLAAAEAPGVFLQPVDVPPLPAAVLQRLTVAAAGEIALPVHRGQGGHPLYLSAGAADRIAAFPAADRLDRILRQELTASVRRVEIADANCLVNLNCPEEWEEFRRNNPHLPECG